MESVRSSLEDMSLKNHDVLVTAEHLEMIANSMKHDSTLNISLLELNRRLLSLIRLGTAGVSASDDMSIFMDVSANQSTLRPHSPIRPFVLSPKPTASAPNTDRSVEVESASDSDGPFTSPKAYTMNKPEENTHFTGFFPSQSNFSATSSVPSFKLSEPHSQHTATSSGGDMGSRTTDGINEPDRGAAHNQSTNNFTSSSDPSSNSAFTHEFYAGFTKPTFDTATAAGPGNNAADSSPFSIGSAPPSKAHHQRARTPSSQSRPNTAGKTTTLPNIHTSRSDGPTNLFSPEKVSSARESTGAGHTNMFFGSPRADEFRFSQHDDDVEDDNDMSIGSPQLAHHDPQEQSQHNRDHGNVNVFDDPQFVPDIGFNIGTDSTTMRGIKKRGSSANKRSASKSSMSDTGAFLFPQDLHNIFNDAVHISESPPPVQGPELHAKESAATTPVPSKQDFHFESMSQSGATTQRTAADDLSGDRPPVWWHGSHPVHKTAEDDSKSGGGLSSTTASFSMPKVDLDTNGTFNLPPGPAFRSSEKSPIPNIAQEQSSAEGATERPLHSNSKASDPEPDNNILALAELYNKQGKELYSIGMYERSLDAYTKCLNLAPKNWSSRATIIGNRAAVFLMVHKYMEAVNDCDDALQQDPTLLKLYIRKGKALMRMGHWKPAEESFSKILQLALDPSSLEIDSLHAIQEAIESAKLEAQAGLREIGKLRNLVTDLISAEGIFSWDKVVTLCDTIMRKSPLYRSAIISKANALIALGQFEDAKQFMEESTRQTAQNIQALYCHRRAQFPYPDAGDLSWTEVVTGVSGACVEVNISQVKNMILCMGYELSHVYLTALKNVKASRNFSAEVMMKVLAVLNELNTTVDQDDLQENWNWVKKELAKMKELIQLKNTADQQFKGKHFVMALNSYTAAIKVDTTAKRWAAILHSNRAAAEISLGLFLDAVQDCNHALEKDPGYMRALLRRARAYRSLNKINDSCRDFRNYLRADPLPSDFDAVQKELDAVLDSQAKAEQRHQQQQQQQQQQAAPSSSRPTSASANSRNSKENNRFHNGNPGYTPFSNATFAEDFAQRPNSARGEGFKSGSTPNYTNNTYAGYSRPSKAQQQQFHAQQQQQRQQSGRGAFGGDGKPQKERSYRDFAFDSSDESEEEIKPKQTFHNHTRNTNSGTRSEKISGSFSLHEKDHYVVLGVDMNASDRDIKLAYRRLALQYHPDKNKDPGAEERFKMISLAYSILNEPGSRREFDLSRPLNGRGRR